MNRSIKALGIILILGLLFGALSAPNQVYAGVTAQTGQAPETPEAPETSSPYFSSTAITLDDGTTIRKDTINGPSVPPPGFEAQRAARPLPASDSMLGAKALNVPAYDWVMGCSAVSSAMIAGYYDNNGLTNMYSGPTNGGLAPFNSRLWPYWTDRTGAIYPNNPLVASHNGVDGLTTRGSIDDYWVKLNSSDPDPFISGTWVEHTWGGAVGDYLKTSQSYYENIDGATTFYNYDYLPSPLTCSFMESHNISSVDGTYGRKLFYQSRGYNVTDCYNQNTDNNIPGGFSFAQYRAEIDAGNPVLLNLRGHSIVGVGYDTASSTVYLHDTWDDQTHAMTWGSSYAGMPLYSVSIVHLAFQLTAPGPFVKSSPANGATNVEMDPILTWQASTGATSYEYCYDTTNDNACSNWASAYTSTGVYLSGLKNNTVYYWQVRAKNPAGITYANGSATAFNHFKTVLLPPEPFDKVSPELNGIDVATNPLLDWQDSPGAVQYLYCIDGNINNSCDKPWTSTGKVSKVQLSGLKNETVYEWQVKAVNAAGTTFASGYESAFSTFTTRIPTPPSAFYRLAPANGTVVLKAIPVLSWQVSDDATRYEYCIDTTNDNTCSTWTSTGAATQVAPGGLKSATTYYWHVRAVNTLGTKYANGGETAFGSFKTARQVYLPLTVR